MTSGLLMLGLLAGVDPLLTPHLALSAPQTIAAVDAPVPPLPLKSGWVALGLSAACELPTAFFGPSCGHLYAGEETHFFATGGLRLADLAALVALDRWAFGTPPLYAVIQPHFSRSLAAWPLAYPLDFLLVALWWGTGLYDLVDSFFAARRENDRAELRRMIVPAPDSMPALLRF